MENTEKVSVFNTVTKKYEKVEVSKEVATAYKRTGWNIDDNDESFFDHEIQMSELIGGKDGAYENFREFVSMSDDLQVDYEKQELIEKLMSEVRGLKEIEISIIQLLFFEGLTEVQCAEKVGLSQQCVSYRKKSILKKLKKFLEKSL